MKKSIRKKKLKQPKYEIIDASPKHEKLVESEPSPPKKKSLRHSPLKAADLGTGINSIPKPVSSD